MCSQLKLYTNNTTIRNGTFVCFNYFMYKSRIGTKTTLPVFFFQTKYEATKIPTRKKIIIVRLSIFESATQTDFLTRWNDKRAYGKCSSEPLFRFLHSHRRYLRPVLITVYDIDKNALRTNKCIYVCIHILLPERIRKKKSERSKVVGYVTWRWLGLVVVNDTT